MIGKDYLGDGVYVEIERGMFKVTTENGFSANNTIYFEPEVYRAFTRYAKRAFEAVKEDSNPLQNDTK